MPSPSPSPAPALTLTLMPTPSLRVLTQLLRNSPYNSDVYICWFTKLQVHQQSLGLEATGTPPILRKAHWVVRNRGVRITNSDAKQSTVSTGVWKSDRSEEKKNKTITPHNTGHSSYDCEP